MLNLYGAFGEFMELLQDFDIIPCEALGYVGVVVEVACFDDEESAVAGDAGWVSARVLRLFLVTMLAS
jgi:hypothetical protein